MKEVINVSQTKYYSDIPNEICPKCGHHAMEHVPMGPHGTGCQTLVGESERHSCNCEEYLPFTFPHKTGYCEVGY